jgi:alkanesulfonate monooxygenase SsuD/methylene tetrahydromethanopterin reductase-like flavin-dependent oxidoreductase (luciferase family)
MAATLDRLSGGRLLINVVTGGDPVELKGDGLFLDHDERYAVTDEFLSIWRKLMQGEEVTETHPHLKIEKGRLLYPQIQSPYPPLYFGGSSAAGAEVAAKHVDVYLTWGERRAAVAEKLALARAAATSLSEKPQRKPGARRATSSPRSTRTRLRPRRRRSRAWTPWGKGGCPSFTAAAAPI